MEKLEYAVAPGWWHGLAPLTFGWEACAPGHQFGPAVRHYHLLHYVLEGEGTFLKGGATYRVDAGDLFVIPRGSHHLPGQHRPPLAIRVAGLPGRGDAPFFAGPCHPPAPGAQAL